MIKEGYFKENLDASHSSGWSKFILVQQTAINMMKVRTPPKPLSYFLWLLPFSGWQVIYVVEMSERMSCKSHFSFLLTFTEMVFLGRVSRENDELYDDHDVLHDELFDEQDEHDV